MSIQTATKYGRWAIVAGASEGLGAAFGFALAARGHDLILMARRAEALRSVADEIQAKHKVSVKTIACDLAAPEFVDRMREAIDGMEVGVAVYNAAYSYMAPLLDRPIEDTLRVVDVNVRGPLRFVHELAPAMVQRKRGAIVLMSSTAGFQGLPTLAAYVASKAFNTVLGESLWAELRPAGVDVLVSCAGAISTPGYSRTTKKPAPGILTPEAVAERTLATLGSGPVVVPGGVNKMANFLLGRVLPRSIAVSIMGKSTAALS